MQTKVTKALAKNVSLVNIFSPFEHGQKIIKDLLRIDIPKKILQTTSYSIGNKLIDYHQKEITSTEKIKLFDKKPINVQYFLTDGGQTPLLENIAENSKVKNEKFINSDKTLKNQPKNEKNYREVKIGLFFTDKDIVKKVSKNQKESIEIKNKRFSLSLNHGLEHFEKAVKKAAQIIGALQAKTIVFISDGAEWCKTIHRKIFPYAIRILDWFHANEHLWEAAKMFFGESEKENYTKWAKPIENLLWEGKVSLALEIIMDTIKSTKKTQDPLLKLYNYYNSNKDAMRYKEFREQGYIIGSGPIESAVKYILTSRFKMTGSVWRRDNAESLMWLRAKYFEDRWDDFWNKMNYQKYINSNTQELYKLAA